MHHLVINIPPGCFADHINHNGLDNRKANLRIATHTQNIWHRRKFIRHTSLGSKAERPAAGGFRKPTRSKYKGVDWSKDMNRWRCRITVNGKRIYLGSFDSETAAAHAYNNAAKKYHGQFAVLNFNK